MSEYLYTEYPELYDAIQSEWDYDRDIAFLEERLAEIGVDGNRVLEIGCGTGEHTCRLLDAGFDVTAIDKYEGMLEVARSKCDADFHQATLPELPVEDTFDVIIMIRGVVNHLPPEELPVALEALDEILAEGGMILFDNSPLPPDGNHPGLDVGTTETGEYARIAQHVATENGRLDWRAVTFLSNGKFFINSRLMTPFDDDRIAGELNELGYDVERFDGFGPADDRTVFVGVKQV